MGKGESVVGEKAVNFEDWWKKQTSLMALDAGDRFISEGAWQAAWQAAQDEQANVIASQIEMLKRLRDERDALLKDVSALVDDDFGANGWNPKADGAAMRLRKLVGKMRADYDE
jgi:uncharacterized protein (UPF0335 family)